MGVRGRKSGASLTVAVTNMPGQRPEPPSELTGEQAEEWRAVVARMPPEWFTRETHPFLVQFCRHVVRSREVEAVLAEVDPRADLDAFYKLTTIAEREGRAVSSLGTRMRLTQHSRYDEKRAATNTRAGKSEKPWTRSA